MTQLKLEVGKKYNISHLGLGPYEFITSYKGDYIFKNYQGTIMSVSIREIEIMGTKITEHIEQPMKEDKLCECRTTQPVPLSEKKEVKLEVGKKYNLYNNFDDAQLDLQPFKLIYQNTYECVFEDCNNRALIITPEQLKNYGITEHREMIKGETLGYFYCSEKPPQPGYVLDQIIGKSCSVIIHANKPQEIEDLEIIYARITIQQLPEPESTEH